MDTLLRRSADGRRRPAKLHCSPGGAPTQHRRFRRSSIATPAELQRSIDSSGEAPLQLQRSISGSGEALLHLRLRRAARGCCVVAPSPNFPPISAMDAALRCSVSAPKSSPNAGHLTASVAPGHAGGRRDRSPPPARDPEPQARHRSSSWSSFAASPATGRSTNPFPHMKRWPLVSAVMTDGSN